MQARTKLLAFTALSLSAAFVATNAAADVTVSSDATQNMSCTSGVCQPTASDAVLNVGDLETLLAAGNVTVATTGSGVQAGSIEINTALPWSNANALALDAYDSIRVDGPVAVIGAGSLSVVTNDGGSGGTFSFGQKGNITFAGTSNALSINGTSYTLVDSLSALASAIATNASGSYALVQSYDAGPDGKYRFVAIPTIFEGNFNGLGNTISHLAIEGKAKHENYGLFNELDVPSAVSSVHLTKMKIEAGSESYAGGIAGLNLGMVYNSSVDGSVDAQRGGFGFYGGAVGGNAGTILEVRSDATINIGPNYSSGAFAGDLVGGNSGTIEDSFATGSVTVKGTWPQAYIGGLVSESTGTVKNCYAAGSVLATDASGDNVIGGLMAFNYFDVASSYSTGVLAAGGTNNYVGGLIGADISQQNGGSINNTYWDTTTSGISNPSEGAGNIPNDPGIKGETTARLQAKLPKGFEHSIWKESHKINNGLPYLIANPPPK